MMSDPTIHDDVDPEVREFLTEVNRAYQQYSNENDDFPARRSVAEKVRAPWTKGGPTMEQIANDVIHGARVRIYRPDSELSQGTLIYLHGGGWVIFSIDTHDRLMREYASRSGLTVVGIDYALAPEHPYPFALNQIENIVDELLCSENRFGFDIRPLLLGGDSAGANLALATAIRLRDRGDSVDGLLLNYGAFDTEKRASSERYDGPNYMLTNQEMANFWGCYIAGDEGDIDDLARPLRADLSKLAPVHLCIPQCDILADENIALSEKLAASGVEVDVQIYAGATHSFLEAVSISKLADQAIENGAAWLKTLARKSKSEVLADHV